MICMHCACVIDLDVSCLHLRELLCDNTIQYCQAQTNAESHGEIACDLNSVVGVIDKKALLF